MFTRVHHIWGIFLIAAVTMSCAATGANQYLDPSVDKESGELRPGLIIISLDRINLGSAATDTSRMMEPANLEHFVSVFPSVFASYTAAAVKRVDTTIQLSELSYRIRDFSLSGGDLQLTMPDDMSVLMEKTGSSDYILFLQNHHFTSGSKYISQSHYGSNFSTPQGFTANRTNSVTLSTKYVIWSRAKDRAVAWGRVEKEKQIGLRSQEQDYLELLGEISKQIVAASPFFSREEGLKRIGTSYLQ